MDKDLFSRRRLIQLGTVGLTTSIAGCSIDGGGRVEDAEPIEDNTVDTPDRNTPDLPDDPPASFRAPTIDYTYYELPVWREDPDPANLSLSHKDSSIFTIEIDSANSATAILQQTNVTRDIELQLRVRDANGEFQTTPAETLSRTDTNQYEQRTVEFDLSTIPLPRGAGSICELTGIDTHPDDDAQLIFKRHQFVGIPHKNGVNWINTERVNHSYYRKDGAPRHDQPRGVNGNPNATPAGHVEHSDSDDERTVFLAVRTPVNGELFGVSAHISHDTYQQYVRGGRSYTLYHNMDYECRYATQISHLQELGTKTDDAINGIGITTRHERLEALGDLIQMIPYGNNIDDNIPASIVLYDKIGDCSNKTGLFASLIQNDPWNMMPCIIDCEVNGQRHFTMGLDVDTLGADFDSTSKYIIRPTSDKMSNGFPDTGYAFFDMTYDSYIGQRSEGVEGAYVYELADYTGGTDTTIANEEPDY
jgi:hypothetical protein